MFRSDNCFVEIKFVFVKIVLHLYLDNLCFCSFCFVLKSLFWEQMYWFCSSSTNVLLTDIFFGSNVLLRSKRSFFFFVFRGANGRQALQCPGLTVSPVSPLKRRNIRNKEQKNEKTRKRDMRKIGKQRHQMEGAKGNKSATNINTHIEWTHPQRHQRKSRKNMKKKQNFVFFCFPKFRCYHPKNPSLIKRNMNKKME